MPHLWINSFQIHPQSITANLPWKRVCSFDKRFMERLFVSGIVKLRPVAKHFTAVVQSSGCYLNQIFHPCFARKCYSQEQHLPKFFKVSHRGNVSEWWWENAPVGDLDVLHITPVDHLLFLTVVQVQTFIGFVLSLFTSVETDLNFEFHQNLAIT